MTKKMTLIAGLAFAFCALLSPAMLNAQETAVQLAPVQTSDADVSPWLKDYGNAHASSKALWDVLFNYNITYQTSSVGCAGVAFINNEFWVSKWASDTIINFSSTGVFISKFFVPGLSGIRSFTSDGTYLYAGCNTTTVYRIDPATKTLAPPHITFGGNVRWITYDPTLNSGAGGFWWGNFATDIASANMTGGALSAIPAATHGLAGMYGAAYDGTTPGGPFLWIFDQSAPNNSQIKCLELPAGNLILDHDAFADVNTVLSLTSALAGGLFLSNTVSPGNVALIGVVQGTPNNGLFAYDIEEPADMTDAAVTMVSPLSGYTIIPERQVFDETFSIEITNTGTQNIDSLYAEVDFLYNGTSVDNQILTAVNLAPLSVTDLVTAAFNPSYGTGEYEVSVMIYTGLSQTDEVADNDTMTFSFQVSDSVFARDNNIPNGTAYVVSSTDWAYAVANYTLTVDDTLTGIWIQLETAVSGDTTFAVVAETTAGIPTSVYATGDTVIIGADTVYFLEFGNPVPLAAGTYSFGCYEGTTAGANLAQSTQYWITGMNFFYTPSGGWTASGIQTARFIRPVFKTESDPTGIHTAERIDFSVYPNPAGNRLVVELPESGALSVRILGLHGQLLSEVAAGNSRTCTMDVSALAEGLYFVQIQTGSGTQTVKFMIAR